MTIEQRDFRGNVAVLISENEVRVWVCREDTGENIFRFKALGKVHKGSQDITVIGRPSLPKPILFDKLGERIR